MGGYLEKGNNFKIRKVAHTFNNISKVFEDPVVNTAALSLNGDSANSLDGLADALKNVNKLLHDASQAKSLKIQVNGGQYFYFEEGKSSKMSYMDLIAKMIKEMNNIRKGKFNSKIFHNESPRNSSKMVEFAQTAPFGTGFIMKPHVLKMTGLFNT
ncbi:hypothetical protein BVX93_01550, partial [bacterium B13(2017)]